jgi:hypothetical protein
MRTRDAMIVGSAGHRTIASEETDMNRKPARSRRL